MSQDLDVKCGRDYPHEGMPTETQGMAKMALDIMFLNSAIDATGALEAPVCLLGMPVGIGQFILKGIFEGVSMGNARSLVRRPGLFPF